MQVLTFSNSPNGPPDPSNDAPVPRAPCPVPAARGYRADGPPKSRAKRRNGRKRPSIDRALAE